MFAVTLELLQELQLVVGQQRQTIIENVHLSKRPNSPASRWAFANRSNDLAGSAHSANWQTFKSYVNIRTADRSLRPATVQMAAGAHLTYGVSKRSDAFKVLKNTTRVYKPVYYCGGMEASRVLFELE